MSGQTLIFCVGAAKSGTSWLAAFLRHHPDCYFRNLKELHYFDTLDEGGAKWRLKNHAKRLISERKNLADQPNAESNTWLPQLIEDMEAWQALFDGETAIDADYLDYIGYGRVSAQVVGDITPSYGQVSREMLKHMAEMAPDVKFVFIMRDPVERLWSGFRMLMARQGEDALEARIGLILGDHPENDTLKGVADYKGTLEKLLDVIPRENLHLEFFERMFSKEAQDRLCDYIGIAPRETLFEHVEHKGKRLELPSILRGEFAKKLEPQYNFVEKFMGGLPPEWTQKMVNA